MPSRSGSPLIVSLDIGTSSTRALLYDCCGRLLPEREVKIPYQQTLTSDGGVECNADRLLHSTLNALKQLMHSCTAGERGRIAAVGASCFWHAILGVDRHSNAVTPVISWADTRPQSQINELSQHLKSGPYHERTGAFVHPTFWPAKILWFRVAYPEQAAKVRCWLSFPDYLALKLGGHTITSISIASGTGLMNESSCDWDSETLRAIGIERDQLPTIAQPGWSFRRNTSRAVPSLPDVPWFPAYGDGACSNIGSGGVDAGTIVVNLSTSGAIRVVCPKPTKPVSPGLFRYRLDNRRWVIGGAVSNAGNIHAWLGQSLALAPQAGFERALRKTVPDGHGLTVLPFWAGERSPGWHAWSRAAILGMNLSTSPLDIAQASLESIAYTFRALSDDLRQTFPRSRQVIISGGMAQGSRYIQQLFGDVLATPVCLTLESEPSGRGAALAIARLIGELSDDSTAKPRLSRPIQPHPEATAAYNKALVRFQKCYDRLIVAPGE